MPSSSTRPEPTFSQDFARRATEARGRLSPNDQRVLDYVREHLDDLPFHTSDTLASEVQVSRAAVVRLATRLGYDGFRELRLRAQADAKRQDTSPLQRFKPGGDSSLLDRKLWQDSENLAMTQQLAGDSLSQAAELVAVGGTVYIGGNRKSYGLAVYLHRVLHGVRPEVRVLDPGFPDEVASMKAADVLVACVFQRYSRQTIQVIEFAKTRDVRIVVVTDGRGHDFIRDADVVLVAATDSPTLYQSMVAPLALLETLAAEVAAAQPRRARRSLEATERFSHEQGLVLE